MLRNFSKSITPKRFHSTLIHPQPNQTLKTLINQHFHHDKYHDLFRHVISTPSVILSACTNLHKPPSSFAFQSLQFSINDLIQDLKSNRFDIESCCVRTGSLVIPNLKLKVVIEAIRIVLEEVYNNGKFEQFVYSGRHTAIRYLKYKVVNPSWWFVVKFADNVLNNVHLNKLCLSLGERVADELLIGFIERLFRVGVLRIELGGSSLRRGFPQECGLSCVLVNVFFSGLDKELGDVRRRVEWENPRGKGECWVRVMEKPVRVYVVRYLDEIMVVTSGSKEVMLGLRNKVLGYLERVLGLNVDRLESVVHSAVREKIEFLGMEFQAVPPSVLRPPMSEKAKRAWKKYEKEKKGRALHRRYARETTRKKLGIKLFDRVFRKLKRTGEFKFDFQIEPEVRDMFGIWADEAAQEFFGSLDERLNWHRKLSSGDFLSLRVIRNQLPQELVESYDQFREQVDKHLSPMGAIQALDKEHRLAEEEERQKYADRTVKDLTTLCMKVAAPEVLIRRSVRLAGFTNSMGRPRPIDLLLPLEDIDIIKWYAGIGNRWLDFYCCCCNFRMVKIVVSYHLRFSCILTLAKKHDSTKKETIGHFCKDLIAYDDIGLEEMHFPSEKGIKMMGDKNLWDPKPVDNVLSLALIRLVTDESLYSCMAHFCNRSDTVLYRIRLLQALWGIDPLDKKSWIYGMGAIHESLDKKCLSLCPVHSSDFYLGKMSLQDVDCTLLVDLV